MRGVVILNSRAERFQSSIILFFTRLQNTSQIDSSLSEVFRKRVRTLRRSPRMLRDMASGLSQISSMTSDITAWAFKHRDFSFDAAESPEEVTGALSERAHGGSPSYIAFITNHGAAAAPPRVACDEGNISHRGVFRKNKKESEIDTLRINSVSRTFGYCLLSGREHFLSMAAIAKRCFFLVELVFICVF